MSPSLRRAISLLLLTGALAAQSTFTAPPGHAYVEGPGATTGYTPFFDPSARAQWTYGMRGNAYASIRKLEMRRDGYAPTNAAYCARYADVQVLMCETDLGKLSPTFANNYVGAPTTVFTKKSLSLPNHMTQPPATPAPWDLAIPYDYTFSYSGEKDLLVELTLENNSVPNSGYSIDCADSNNAGTGSYAYVNAAGYCTTPNGPFSSYARNPQTSYLQLCTISTWAMCGPSYAAGVLAIGLGDPNLSGVLCKALRTTAEITVPVTTDAVGAIQSAASPLSLSFPLAYAVTLYAQFAALDATQSPHPVALSNALRLNCVPWIGSPTSFLYSWGPSGGAYAATGTRFASAVPIVRFTY